MDGASASASKPQNVYTPSWGTSDLPVPRPLVSSAEKVGGFFFLHHVGVLLLSGGTLKARGHQNTLAGF